MNGERTQQAAAIVRRLREPSTWAGLSVLLALVGVNPMVVQLIGSVLDVAPTLIQAVSAVGGATGALAAMAIAEKGAPRS